MIRIKLQKDSHKLTAVKGIAEREAWENLGVDGVEIGAGYWLGVTSDWTIEQPFGSKANFSGFFFPVKNCNKPALFSGHDETL